MSNLEKLKSCDLHVHLGGCLSAEDLVELGRGIYDRLDWGLFLDAYEHAFGVRPDPVALFREAEGDGAAGLLRLREHYIVGPEDSGDFDRFQAKFNLAICLYRYWRRVLQRDHEIVRRIIERHRAEGLDWVEYRAMYMLGAADPEGFVNFHRLNARVIQEASRNGFEGRYLVSLPRQDPVTGYALVQRLLDESPELIPTIVGLDFCYVEEGHPPCRIEPFLARVAHDNGERPGRSLQVAYHVGEVFFDKSLESAIRWCHEVAEMGTPRLGHAIALGLDPAVAVGRRPRAHLREPASERRAQIDYDLRWAEELAARGVTVDPPALRRELEALARGHPEAKVERPYTPERLEEARRRQDLVLERLAVLGTTIESCPTSNLRIGGVPDAASHPVHRFLNSDVNLVIGADDPGIFDAPLADEIEWVVAHTAMDADSLARRLGDPRRFRFGRQRRGAR